MNICLIFTGNAKDLRLRVKYAMHHQIKYMYNPTTIYNTILVPERELVLLQ